VTAFRDPALAGYSYQHVAVFFPTSDRATRAKLESEIVRELRKRQVAATEGTAIIPPTQKTLPDAEFQAALARAGKRESVCLRHSLQATALFLWD
jgi:hypothetical protein